MGTDAEEGLLRAQSRGSPALDRLMATQGCHRLLLWLLGLACHPVRVVQLLFSFPPSSVSLGVHFPDPTL